MCGVDSAARFPDLLRQAFRESTSGTPGPVHLELRGSTGQMLDKEAEYDLTFEQRYTRFPPFRPEAGTLAPWLMVAFNVGVSTSLVR